MSDAFGSAWFAAIYLLLFVVAGWLPGVPRIRLHAKAISRQAHCRPPKHLDRLPESGRFETTASVEDASVASRAVAAWWRVIRRDEGGGVLNPVAREGPTAGKPEI